MTKQFFNKAKELLKNIVVSWGKVEVYLVGGCVRDLILGENPKDIDLCVDLQDGSEKFCEYLKQEWSDICSDFSVFKRYGTCKFSLLVENKKLDIECVMPRTEDYKDGPRKPSSVQYSSLYEDSLRRDFCCNALYMNIKDDKIIDPTGKGLQDISFKILRTPTDPDWTFDDDPLRMLRAIRFHVCKGFSIDHETMKALHNREAFWKLSRERIQEEFTKIMLSPNPVEGIKLLHEGEFLGDIIPSLESGWGFNQRSKYHSLTLTEHLFKVLDNVAKVDNSITTRLAALLHDIAKPWSYQEKSDGSYSYKGHDKESAKFAEIILKKLKYSNEIVEKVCTIISNHMILKSCWKNGKYWATPKTTRKIYRLLSETGCMSDILCLIDADNNAHAPEYCMLNQVDQFIDESEKYKSNIPEKKSPVSGDDIIATLGIQPGPAIKEFKEIVSDMLDTNPNLTKEQILYMLKDDFYGKSFWGVKFIDKAHYYSIQPKKNSYGFFSTDPYEVYLEISKLLPGINEDTPVEFMAVDYPKLYKLILAHLRVREILDKYDNLWNELSCVGGLKNIKLAFDLYGDLSGEIDWDGFDREYIM